MDAVLRKKLKREEALRKKKAEVEAIVGRQMSNEEWVACGGERNCEVDEVANRMKEQIRNREEAQRQAEPPKPAVPAKVSAAAKVACPHCGNIESTVERTIGNIRYRYCRKGCGRHFRTVENASN